MDKKWICFIGLIFLLMDVECNSPPPLTNGNYTVIIPNQLLAYYCVNGTNFTRFGTTVITLQNQNNQWPSSLNNTCVKPSTVNVTATCKPPATPPSTAVSSNVTTGLETIMNAYVCPNGTFWITGIDVRLSTCENGNWTEIYDFCDVGCLMRKHCGDIAAMGMMTNASYNVISTGNIFDPVSSVLCYFTSSGNWTTIFNNGMTLSFYSYYYTNYQSYKNVYNSYYSKNYFIGLDYLANVSKSLSLMGSSAKMILEVIFTDSSSNILAWTTYNNFTIDDASTNFTLASLGSHGGTAGDLLYPNLNTQFQSTPTSMNQWWGVNDNNKELYELYNASFFTDYYYCKKFKSYFPALVNISMRINPTTDDNGQCPPEIGSELWWANTTIVNIPYLRYPGANITWLCSGFMMMAIQDGKPMTSGNITCKMGINGNDPYWDSKVVLPCAKTCPENFTFSGDRNSCFMFSNETATNIVDAAQKCLALNSNLGIINNVSDLSNALPGKKYYSGFSYRGINYSTPSTLALNWQNMNCLTNSSVCLVNENATCMAVSNPYNYEYVDCQDATNYACQKPGMCIHGFDSVDGACYLSDYQQPGLRTYYSSLAICSAYGGSMAYPTSKFQLNSLAGYISKKLSSSMTNLNSVTFLIGLNNFGGDFTAGGMYDPDEDLIVSLPNSTDSWLSMTVYTNGSFSIDEVDILSRTNSLYFVCQLFGVLDCKTSAPDPLLNMIRNSTQDLSYPSKTSVRTVAIYECYPGYFFNGNLSSEATVMSLCLGTMGNVTGWFPEELREPCEPVQVCDDSQISLNSKLISNTTYYPESYYLNGTIEFQCPSGMALLSNSTLMSRLNATCITNNITYTFQPSVILCDICVGEINFTNAIVTFNTNKTGTSAILNCDQSCELPDGSSKQTINCTESGWNVNESIVCYKVCSDMPPAVQTSDNIIIDNSTNRLAGTSRLYWCIPGYYFKLSSDFPTVVNSTEVMCNDSGKWVPQRTPLNCAQFCVQDPPQVPNTLSDWDNFTRDINHKINYATVDDYLFANFNKTWTLICNGTDWVTAISSANDTDFISKPICTNDPPSEVGQAMQYSFNASYGFVGDIITYHCPDKMATDSGLRFIDIECEASQNWTSIPADALCELSCGVPPPKCVTRATYNYTGNFSDGVVVAYECKGGFDGGLGMTLYVNCTDGNWTLDSIPTCRK